MYLVFYVWNECPLIFKMELVVIKEVAFGSIKYCYDIEEVHSKREGLEIMALHLPI